MLEDLRALLDGSAGEALDVPHPNTFKKQEMVPLTKWHRSELPTDFEKNSLGGPKMIEDPNDPEYGRPLTFIRGQIVSMTMLDNYDEPVGEPIYAVNVKIENPKEKMDDISSDRIRVFNIVELKRRFPKAFAEFEAKIGPAKLPIVLLDTVPPYVVQQIRVSMGAKTILDFANFDDGMMQTLRSKLDAAKLSARIPYLASYRDKAREKVGWTVPEPAEPRAAPRKEKAAA